MQVGYRALIDTAGGEIGIAAGIRTIGLLGPVAAVERHS